MRTRIARPRVGALREAFRGVPGQRNEVEHQSAAVPDEAQPCWSKPRAFGVDVPVTGATVGSANVGLSRAGPLPRPASRAAIHRGRQLDHPDESRLPVHLSRAVNTARGREYHRGGR